MEVRKGLPEGVHVRLQEAVTWAFTGWSWSRQASLSQLKELEQRADYPAHGSLLDSYRTLDPNTDHKSWEIVYGRFDRRLSDACFRGELKIVARRPNLEKFEEIPYSYFIKPRGFSYFYGNEISSVPAYASLEEICSSGENEKWIDVIVNSGEFQRWFGAYVAELSGGPERPEPVPAKSQRGPKPKYDWDAFIRRAREIYAEEGGINPKVDPGKDGFSQASLEQQMTGWAEKEWGKAPSESTVREHVKSVIEEIRKGEGRQFRN